MEARGSDVTTYRRVGARGRDAATYGRRRGLAHAGSAVVPRAPSGPEAMHRSVAYAHRCVYVDAVKRRELERRLRSLGWVRLRHGSRHDV